MKKIAGLRCIHGKETEQVTGRPAGRISRVDQELKYLIITVQFDIVQC